MSELKLDKLPSLNVVANDAFRKRVAEVFDIVAKTLSKTLGPYGANTIIEKLGEMHITKDGWTVLKGLSFDERIDNNILKLLYNIAAQVVIKVGDGSTSSIVAANSVLKEITSSDFIIKSRGKDVCKTLDKLVIELTDIILNSASKVDAENFTEEESNKIFDIAMISTNGDIAISNIIKDIYLTTQNPNISYVKGKYSETVHEIVKGYKLEARMLDKIFATNDNGECEIEMPLFLLFDHKIGEEHLHHIIKQVAGEALSSNRKLVIMAPHYDRLLLETIANETNMLYRSNKNLIHAIYSKVTMVNNLQKQYFYDFAALVGANVINEATARSIVQDANRKAMAKQNEDQSLENVEEIDILACVGQCQNITIGLKETLVTGLTHSNEDMIEILMKDAISTYNIIADKYRNLAIVGTELFEVKTRISKLKCNMGIIEVGGKTTLEQQATYDLVDDAVKACENAYTYGYNVGCNMAIIKAIRTIFNEDNSENRDELEVELLNQLFFAFSKVYAQVLSNKYPFDTEEMINSKFTDIFNTSLETGLPVDIVTGEVSEKIINPCMTDIEILKATTSIISLILSSNQYLTTVFS